MERIPDTGDMPPDQFRRYGRQVVDWIAGYLAHPERFPILSQVAPGEIASMLPASAPDDPENMDAILADFADVILPGITHWNHPAFFAYFAITASAPGILAEFLSAALNVNAMLWRTSPAATELETVTLDWLRRMLGLSDGWEGVIYDTASISTLVAIAAAREATGLDIRERGATGRDLPTLRLYCSDQAHSSVEKDAITLGIGAANVRKIASDSQFRMDVDALRRAVEEDLGRGMRPFCVVATVGTTSTTSVDPVRAIAQVAREHGLWLHVDGAYGGTAAILPEKRWILDGLEEADSLVVNPHKWLFTPVDLSAFYSRSLSVVRDAFSLVPEYLRTPETDVRNYMDYGPQLGRRFRALKLWFILRTFGVEGIRARLRQHIDMAAEFAGWVRDAPDWEILAPVPFSVVVFRAHPDGLDEDALDRLNEAVMERVNTSGEAFLSHTRLPQFALRLAIGHLNTQETHVRRVWELLRESLNAELSRPARPFGTAASSKTRQV